MGKNKNASKSKIKVHACKKCKKCDINETRIELEKMIKKLVDGNKEITIKIK